MKQLAFIAIALTLLGVGSALILSVGPPYLMRTRLHHFLHAEGMTRLARALVDSPQELGWITMGEGKVRAGEGGKSAAEAKLSQQQQDSLRPLFHEASIYYLLSFPTSRGRGAGVQLWGGSDAGKQYSVHVYFQSDPRANRKPCEDGYLNSDIGNCFVDLDEDWIYELIWYDPEYISEQMELERGVERRITIP